MVLTLALVASLGVAATRGQDPPPAPPALAPKTVAGVTFTPPPDSGWLEEPVTSRMRAAQYRVRRAEGDAEDAELVVFHFGGSAGSVEDNLTRWFAQFQQPDGKPTREAAKVERRELGGLVLHEVEVGGTYVAETRPGSGERVNKPGSRLLGAIIETPSGPFFVKLVGPDATVAAARAAFKKFVESFSAEH
jgi:hypothetical protein